MGSSSPTKTTTVNKTELPEWLNRASQENIALADEIASRPYQPYTGNTVAGLSPDTTAAWDYARAGVGMTDPYFNYAANTAGSVGAYQPQTVTAGQFAGSDLSPYMNPYIAEVEQRALDAGNRSLISGINTIGDSAARAGAFGGSRQGVMEGVATSESARSLGDLSANLRMQGFNTAAGLMSADQNRAMQAALANQSAGLQGANLNLNAANSLSQIAQNAQQARAMDTAMLESVGGQQQAYDQRLLDDAYARFLEQRNYPIDMLNLRLGATSATPYGGTQTQTSTGPGGNSTLSTIGTVGSIAASAATIAAAF